MSPVDKPPLRPTKIVETVGKFTNPRKALQKAVDTVKAAKFVPHPEEKELLQYIAAASARGLQGVPVKTALLNLTQMRVQRELTRMAAEKEKRPKIQSNGIDTGHDLSHLVSQ